MWLCKTNICFPFAFDDDATMKLSHFCVGQPLDAYFSDFCLSVIALKSI